MRTLNLQLAIAAFIPLSLGLLLHQSFSAESFYLQLAHILAGLLIAYLILNLKVNYLQSFHHYVYLMAVLLLLITIILGVTSQGATRWIQIGSFRLQPSEFSKPLLILAFASWVTHIDLGKITQIIKLGLIFTLPIILIFLQPDFGSAFIVSVTLFAMIFAAGIRYKHQILAVFLGVSASPVLWNLLQDYQQQRVMTFLNPLADPLGKGYNSIQSLIAVGSGQLLGRGLGHGTQSKLRFLPEHQTDFIFASLAEELGLIGTLAIVLSYAWLYFHLIKLAHKSSDQFSYLVIVGIASLFALEAFINIGMNIGLLPITGITLPLVSSGGSSIVSSLITLAIASQLASETKNQPGIEIT